MPQPETVEIAHDFPTSIPISALHDDPLKESFCKRCDHVGENKRTWPACVKCEKRLQANGESLTPEPPPTLKAIPEKRCSGPCKQLKPATSEYFHRDNSRTDRLQNVCKSCRTPLRVKRYNRHKGETYFVVDLLNYGALAKTVKEIAEKEVRSPEQQIVFWIVQGIERYSKV
jgi:hypothetical protein